MWIADCTCVVDQGHVFCFDLAAVSLQNSPVQRVLEVHRTRQGAAIMKIIPLSVSPG